MSQRSPDDRRSPKDEEDLPPLPEDGVRKDLRFSKREDLGVEITRDLSGSGWLARGDNTRMSKLSFRMGGVPREQKDPELAALSDPPPREKAKPAPAPEPVAPPVTAESAPPPVEPEPAGPIEKFLGKIFGRAKGN